MTFFTGKGMLCLGLKTDITSTLTWGWLGIPSFLDKVLLPLPNMKGKTKFLPLGQSTVFLTWYNGGLFG